MESANSTKNPLEAAIDDTGRQKQWVATKLGISRVTLHRWCTGEYPVPEDQQPKVIALLFPELDESASEAKRLELFPEEAVSRG